MFRISLLIGFAASFSSAVLLHSMRQRNLARAALRVRRARRIRYRDAERQ